MGFADGFFINDKEHQMKLISQIRKYQPDIVLCNAFDDRHIDHPKASDLTSHACFLSGLRKIDNNGRNWGFAKTLETKQSISLYAMEKC